MWHVLHGTAVHGPVWLSLEIGILQSRWFRLGEMCSFFPLLHGQNNVSHFCKSHTVFASTHGNSKEDSVTTCTGSSLVLEVLIPFCSVTCCQECCWYQLCEGSSSETRLLYIGSSSECYLNLWGRKPWTWLAVTDRIPHWETCSLALSSDSSSSGILAQKVREAKLALFQSADSFDLCIS